MTANIAALLQAPRIIAGITPASFPGYLLYECQQGTSEWLQCRAGVVTASDFKKVRETYKVPKEKLGQPKDSALDVAFQKAIERICQVPLDENNQTWQMKRGHLLEPFARAAHEDLLERRAGTSAALSDVIVDTAGFMTTPDGIFGCSVDGLIGEQGGAEYKCLVSAKKLRKVILFDDISDYMDQIQGCMWISGRKWWHFGLYCPALKPIGMEFRMMEVERDDDYIDALVADLMKFKGHVDGYEAQLRDMGAAAIAEAAEEVRARLREEPSEAEPAEVDE